jgi:hypothetical protein
VISQNEREGRFCLFGGKVVAPEKKKVLFYLVLFLVFCTFVISNHKTRVGICNR